MQAKFICMTHNLMTFRAPDFDGICHDTVW
jgi:hypothetical protein